MRSISDFSNVNSRLSDRNRRIESLSRLFGTHSLRLWIVSKSTSCSNCREIIAFNFGFPLEEDKGVRIDVCLSFGWVGTWSCRNEWSVVGIVTLTHWFVHSHAVVTRTSALNCQLCTYVISRLFSMDLPCSLQVHPSHSKGKLLPLLKKHRRSYRIDSLPFSRFSTKTQSFSNKQQNIHEKLYLRLTNNRKRYLMIECIIRMKNEKNPRNKCIKWQQKRNHANVFFSGQEFSKKKKFM